MLATVQGRTEIHVIFIRKHSAQEKNTESYLTSEHYHLLPSHKCRENLTSYLNIAGTVHPIRGLVRVPPHHFASGLVHTNNINQLF